MTRNGRIRTIEHVTRLSLIKAVCVLLDDGRRFSVTGLVTSLMRPMPALCKKKSGSPDLLCIKDRPATA